MFPPSSPPSGIHMLYGSEPSPLYATEPSPSHELAAFIHEVSDQLSAEYERIRSRATEDPGTAGDEGEGNWRDLLASWLPEELTVVTKGRILGSNGVLSPQLDVVVLRPGYPRAIRTKKVYLAGAVLAAFECKLTLKAEHIPKVAATARAIRALEDNGPTPSPHDELRSSILFGLLAHNTAIRDKPVERIDSLLSKELRLDTHPRQSMDVVCVANLMSWRAWYVILAKRAMGNVPKDAWLAIKKLHDLYDDGAIRTLYTRWVPWEGNDAPPNPLYQLIGDLLSRIAWDLPASRSLARYWRKSQTIGVGGGAIAARSWPFSVLSEETRPRVERGGLTSLGQFDPWGMSDG